MTLTYFIDDSGQSDPPVFVLGGIGIPTDCLEEFSNEWRTVLTADPALPYFKMKEANRCKGEFTGFSPEARDQKLKRLASVIERHARLAVSISVRHDDYRRHFHGQMMDVLDRPYQILFHLIIATACKLQNRLNIPGPAHFIFDRQQGEERSLNASFACMREGLMPDIQAFLAEVPRHADDRDEVALQAADMVAWHVRRAHSSGCRISETSAAGPRLEKLHSRHEFLDKPALAHLVSAATGTIRQLRTLFPYEAEQVNGAFASAATFTNLHQMAAARPFVPMDLISFPASGTARFLLVRSCALLNRPHLHKRDGNTCRGPETAA